MKHAALALVRLLLPAALALACAPKPTGHATIARCVDGQVRVMEVPLDQVDSVEDYEACGDAACVPKGQACPAAPPAPPAPPTAEGFGAVRRCVDGRVRESMVPLSEVAEAREEYVACGPNTCVPRGQTCPPPVDFDAPDRRCSNDSECVGVYSLYVREGACCQTCTEIAAASEWAARADSQCAAMGDEGCPLKKCVALEPVACVAGACVVRKAASVTAPVG
ncbi:MAG: hypothetical protein R3B09_24470 [Nannocystaceae bacterium]